MSADGEIIVLGTATGSAETIEELLRESLAHVRRSRTEPGCLQHGVSRDAEDPLRLVFVERWASREDLDVHFAVPGSAELLDAVSRLSAAPPTLEILPIQPGG